MSKRKTKKWIVWTSILVIITISVVFALSPNGSDGENQRSTVKAERKNITDKALAVGSIEPVNEIEVKSKVSGVVGKIYANVGDFVRAGDPLFEIKPDPTPLELAQVKRDVEMAEIEKENLSRELERFKKLKAEGFVSEQNFESLNRQHEEAVLKVEIAKERLLLTDKGKVTIAGTEIETVVKAPMTGFILEKSVNLGDPVVPLTSYQPGTSLMRMADMKDLIFKGTVDEIDVGKIRENLTCNLQVGAIPGKDIIGRVTLISLKAKKEDNTTVFPIEIRIDDAKGAVLRAGYSANANIIIDKRDSVLSIPERVVSFRNDSAFVEIPKGTGNTEEVFIKTGLSDAILIEVLEGLNEGDDVLEKEVKEII
jgi:HlyD family secretion protein